MRKLCAHHAWELYPSSGNCLKGSWWSVMTVENLRIKNTVLIKALLTMEQLQPSLNWLLLPPAFSLWAAEAALRSPQLQWSPSFQEVLSSGTMSHGSVGKEEEAEALSFHVLKSFPQCPELAL